LTDSCSSNRAESALLGFLSIGRKKRLEKWKEREIRTKEHPAGEEGVARIIHLGWETQQGGACAGVWPHWDALMAGMWVCAWVSKTVLQSKHCKRLLIKWMKLYKAHFLFCRVLFEERFIHSDSTVSDHGWKWNNLCLILGFNSVSCL